MIADPDLFPRPDVLIALVSWLWVPGIGLVGTFLVLLFPDGHLPSPRWRRFAWFSAAVLVVSSIALMLAPGPLTESGFPDVQNPLGMEGLRPFLEIASAAVALIPLCIVGCAVALIRRFRRSRGQERLQLKWLATAAGVTAAAYLAAIILTFILDSPWNGKGPAWLNLMQSVAVYSFVLIPLAVGVAILRHRLYDIDLIINRTLVYFALTAALATVYFLGVTVLQGLFSPITGESGLAVAGSTLTVAALFTPLAHVFRASSTAASIGAGTTLPGRWKSSLNACVMRWTSRIFRIT